MTTAIAKIEDRIPGAGIDAPLDRRPGVPMQADPPRPAGEPHWTEPERQRDPGNVLRRAGLTELTPVFGTTLPPRALSGAIRRMAYKIPDHRASHWFLLLLGDRVDVLEHDLLRLAPFALGLGGACGAVLFAARMRRRRRSRWLAWLA